jgi:bifunctional non-homologous end joining protein LigD
LNPLFCGAEFVVAFQRRKPAAIGVKAPFPGFIEPAPASWVDKLPSGKRWIHEIKFDGYRVQLHIHNEDDPKVFTRRGNDWTKRFKKIADDAFLINGGTAIIDGEVVVPAVNGLLISRCFRTNCAGGQRKLSWSHSTCSISTDLICDNSR